MADLPGTGAPLQLPERLFPAEEVFTMLKEMRDWIREQKLEKRQAATQEDLESGEPGMEVSFQNPLVAAQGQFYQTRITSITNDQTTVYGVRLIPSTSSTSPWMDDPSFTGKVLTGKIPYGVIPPTVGMLCLFHFTGLSSGTSQYAVYTPSGIKRVKVKSIDVNALSCVALDDSGNETGPQFLVAKPWELRQSTYHGQTIGGVTYTGLTSQRRSATNGTIVETQSIAPAYVANVSRILVGRVQNEPANMGVVATDLNEGARAWAYEEE